MGKPLDEINRIISCVFDPRVFFIAPCGKRQSKNTLRLAASKNLAARKRPAAS